MATTRLIPMHQNKGKSVSQCLADRTEYAKNPNKTAEGQLICAYGCDPATVDAEFLAAKRIYIDRTGRSQQSDVIAYQVRQSFLYAENHSLGEWFKRGFCRWGKIKLPLL